MSAYRTAAEPSLDTRTPLPDLTRHECRGCGERGTLHFQRCIGYRLFRRWGDFGSAMISVDTDRKCFEDRDHIHVLCHRCSWEEAQASHAEMRAREAVRERERLERRRARIEKAKPIALRALSVVALCSALALAGGTAATLTSDLGSLGAAIAVMWITTIVSFYAGRLVKPEMPVDETPGLCPRCNQLGARCFCVQGGRG